MKTLKMWAAAVSLVLSAGTTHAALISLGDGTVKDDNTGLIWLQNWSATGQANWATQMAWAENLTFANSSEWALPSVYEYDDLFRAYGDPGQRNEFEFEAYSPFYGRFYWSSTLTGYYTSVVPRPETFIPDGGAEIFHTLSGGSGRSAQDLRNYAVAVRPGDVAAAVPEPQTLALALLALGAGLLASRRRPR